MEADFRVENTLNPAASRQSTVQYMRETVSVKQVNY